MKNNVLFFCSLCLHLCCVFSADLQKISGTVITHDDQPFPLDMAENSVDDMYSTCATEMEAKVNNIFFKNEIKNKLFKNAWTQAKKCTERNIKQTKKDEALTRNHMQAICTYTAGGKAEFYKTFNEEIRTKGKEYGSSFRFHSLPFWLTRAIQILNENNVCETTFRRINVKFTVNTNEDIRFGMFTSTSKSSELYRFGKTTCFQITTCHGAYLKKYPDLGDKEQEVLIPPYEKFKIISKDKTEGLEDYKTVYVLDSTGIKSNLNCSVTQKILL
ncbi:hypothetical protein ATANTOWER_004889 [Ataeniobius toweri]|uniref:NAD(P)(+)--arginine ADP-ribosyltransferase n=1 Tax=Ataeniobius toweri TaxID=208326 RepID=A0ABU7A5C1_9TELE|nr:hypothetical protein [Ataeniobius toweri]